MALETLRYGSFKPTAVVTEAKSLPGYGGDVQDWTNYKFAVEAIQKKESMLSKEQQEKLGPLGLRLAERLIGPALQVAKKIGRRAEWQGWDQDLAEGTGEATSSSEEAGGA